MSSSSEERTGTRIRARGFVLLASAALLVVAGVLARSPVPLFAALPLLLTPLAAIAGAPTDLGPVDLRWEAKGLGPELDLEGSVSGRFGRWAEQIAVVPPAVGGATVRRPVEVRSRPDLVEFSVGWTLAEPVIGELASPAVVWRDPLGLFERILDGARPRLPIERYPPELHRLGSIRLDRTLQLPGEVRSRRIGSSGEFFGIRDAAADEPPRLINWKASARLGRLLANDFQLDRTGDLLLVLDVRPTRLGREADERLLGVARAGMFGIAESLLRGKVRVGFASFGEFVTALPLSTGRVHRVRLERAVLSSRRAEVAGPPDRLTFGLRRYFRPGLTTLLVSSWDGDRGFELLPYLQRAGYPSIMVSPSPLSLRPKPRAETSSLEERVVGRLERAERRARLATLWEHGPVIDWTDYWSLEGLVRFLRQPPRRRYA